MDFKVQILKKEILQNQEELRFIVDKFGAGSPQALSKSILLDKLINEMNSFLKHKPLN